MPLRIVITSAIDCSVCKLPLTEREWQSCYEDEHGELCGEHAECKVKRIVKEAFDAALPKFKEKLDGNV